jgi:hypothetical protein
MSEWVRTVVLHPPRNGLLGQKVSVTKSFPSPITPFGAPLMMIAATKLSLMLVNDEKTTW